MGRILRDAEENFRNSVTGKFATILADPPCTHIKKQLWGGKFWTDGYCASIVGQHGGEKVIANYVKNQGGAYKKLHEDYQLALF